MKNAINRWRDSLTWWMALLIVAGYVATVVLSAFSLAFVSIAVLLFIAIVASTS